MGVLILGVINWGIALVYSVGFNLGGGVINQGVINQGIACVRVELEHARDRPRVQGGVHVRERERRLGEEVKATREVATHRLGGRGGGGGGGGGGEGGG